MYLKSKSKKNMRFGGQEKDKFDTDRTQPEDIFDFHQEIARLKKRALDEGEGNRFGYYADYDNGKGVRKSSIGNKSSRPSSNRRNLHKQKRLLRQK